MVSRKRMQMFDKLPPTVRRVLAEAPRDWNVAPFYLEMRDAGATEAELIAMINKRRAKSEKDQKRK